MWKRPALHFVGCASEKNAPLSESIFTRRPVIFPSLSASSPCMW